MNYETENKKIDITIYISKSVVPVLERKWLAILVFLLCFILALSITLLIRPEYVTEATLLVEEPHTKAASKRKEDEVVPQHARGTYVATAAEKLKGNRIAAEVYKILPKRTREDFKTSLRLGSQIISGLENLFHIKLSRGTSGISEKRLILGEMRERLRVETNPRNALILISFRTIDKEAGIILLKSYIDVWMALNLEDNKKQVKAKADFASDQRNKAYEAYQKAEENMIKFRKRFEIPGELEVARDVEINLELGRLQSKLDMARKRYSFMDQVFLETRMKEAGVVGNISLIGSPTSLFGRSKKQRIWLMLYGTAAGLILGIGFALLPDLIKGPIRHENDITTTVHLPVLGHIPKV